MRPVQIAVARQGFVLTHHRVIDGDGLDPNDAVLWYEAGLQNDLFHRVGQRRIIPGADTEIEEETASGLQHAIQLGDTCGPLGEIEFAPLSVVVLIVWCADIVRNRCDDFVNRRRRHLPQYV
jgi:hypothetical protein